MVKINHTKRRFDLSPFESEAFVKGLLKYLRLIGSIILAYKLADYLALSINGEIDSYTSTTKNAFESILCTGLINILFFPKNLHLTLLIQGIALFVATSQPEQTFIIATLTQLILVSYLVVKHAYELAVKFITANPQKPKEPETKEEKIVVFLFPLLKFTLVGLITLIFAALGMEVIVCSLRSF